MDWVVVNNLEAGILQCLSIVIITLVPNSH